MLDSEALGQRGDPVAALDGAHQSGTETVPGGIPTTVVEAEMPKITVITEGGRVEFENDSVQNVADLVRLAGPSLNIGAEANIAVNGVAASDDTELAEGDEVTTTKPAGTKGV